LSFASSSVAALRWDSVKTARDVDPGGREGDLVDLVAEAHEAPAGLDPGAAVCGCGPCTRGWGLIRECPTGALTCTVDAQVCPDARVCHCGDRRRVGDLT